jgi:hypothetical protein
MSVKLASDEMSDDDDDVVNPGRDGVRRREEH